jgi:hypothetical protein
MNFEAMEGKKRIGRLCHCLLCTHLRKGMWWLEAWNLEAAAALGFIRAREKKCKLPIAGSCPHHKWLEAVALRFFSHRSKCKNGKRKWESANFHLTKQVSEW